MLGRVSEEGEGGARRQSCGNAVMRRKEKRNALKKQKRTKKRREVAMKLRQDEMARMNDPYEHLKLRLMEEEESRKMEIWRKEFEDRERLWVEAMEKKQAEDNGVADGQLTALQELENNEVENYIEFNEDGRSEYIDDGPAKVIWQGNEIIVQKTGVKVVKSDLEKQSMKEVLDNDRPTSNPFPPQFGTFDEYKDALIDSTHTVFESVSQQSPNFGTEQDKAHCPFHFKTGACRFGHSCSRLHIYPDKSCTLLVKNMYNGPGLAWEQDEELEHTDEEIERCYEEFYEDVHTEFLKYGEILNFKVCKNCSSHLRGNVYVHYRSLDSAQLAYHSINGRYFAGKQVTCEFVNVARWKVAICGEYMKSRMKSCSRGNACNFIHCFCNPGSEYDWANWDQAAPRYWVKKMASLFGYSDEYGYYEKEKWSLEERSNSIEGDRHENSRRSNSRSRDDRRLHFCSGEKRRERSKLGCRYQYSNNKSSRHHDYSCTGKSGRRRDNKHSSCRSGSRRKHPRREEEIGRDRWDGGGNKKDETDSE